MAPKLGEYLLQKPIGRGAMGQVWLAKQESLDRLVAVKVLPKELAKDASFRARFEREAKTAASLIHPNVIQIYSFGIEQDVPYFAMEFVEGEDLGAKIRKGQEFTIKEAVRIVSDVARALGSAAEKGMVHRDIKPGNVMISKKGIVKVMDFGLAKAASVRSSITQPGLIMGTPTYMSPEQGKGHELDVRSDMYSAGIVLYKLLTGTVPFQADTPTAVIFLHIYESPKPMREINPDIPEELERIVDKLLQKNPDDRYPDPGALVEDLDAFLSGATTVKTGAAPAAGEPVFSTEAIGAPGQVAPRTETMDAQPQATSVTEPIMRQTQDIAAARTQAAAPPAGYVTTKDEQLTFLEDLMQGEDPGAYARAADVFEKNPGMRDSYAKQQFVHALLRSQVDSRDRISRNKRVTRVLSIVGRAAGPAAPVVTVKSGMGLTTRSRSPVLYVIIAACAFFVLAGVMFMVFIPSFPEAAATLQLVRRNLATANKDLTYQVRLVMYAPMREEFMGTLHMKGERWILDLGRGPYIKGSDGGATWLIQPGQYAYLLEEGKEPPPIDSIAMEIPMISVDDLLVSHVEFHMNPAGDATLDSYPDRDLVLIQCTAIPGRTESPIQQVKYWVDKKAGLLVHAEMALLAGPLHKGHREVILDYTGEESCNVLFYNYDYHKGGRSLYSGEPAKPDEPETPPWDEYSPKGPGPR